MRSLCIFCVIGTLIAGCGQQDAAVDAPTERTAVTSTAAVPPVATFEQVAQPQPPRAPAAPSPPPLLIGESIARAQWRKAENRADCAPLALASDGGVGGRPRMARFSGGWAVAFDLPGLRSAYGFAGPSLIPDDLEDVSTQRARLAEQWPHMRSLSTLPEPAFAGYGLEGARDYPADNRNGVKMHSLAYLRIGGQRCNYNVWSRLSRTHLEHLLDHLRLLTPGPA